MTNRKPTSKTMKKPTRTKTTPSLPMTSTGVAVNFPTRRHAFVRDLQFDRGYSGRDHFTAGAHQFGYDVTLDLYPADRTKRQKFEGALVIDGGVFCPALPSKLRNLPAIPKNPSPHEVAVLTRLYDERAAFSFKVRKNLGDGRLSIECPARAGAVRCPHVRSSNSTNSSKPTIKNPPHLPKNPDRAKDSMRCCTQEVNVLPKDVEPKIRQKYLYGTSKWVKSYGRRASVEFANSLLRVHYGRIDRGWSRSFDDTGILVLLSIRSAASNIRHLRQWAQDHGGVDPVHAEWKYPAPRKRIVDGRFEHQDSDGESLIAA